MPFWNKLFNRTKQVIEQVDADHRQARHKLDLLRRQAQLKKELFLERLLYKLELVNHKLDLRTCSRTESPEEWAKAQLGLAFAYYHLRDERAENLEQAIYHFGQALDEYTREAFREKWAGIQHDLGLAYTKRIHGDPADNIERAIHHYRQALEVYTREAFPKQWATIQRNLADAYSERGSQAGHPKDRAEDLGQAIDRYKQVLKEVYTREAFPKEWVMTQLNLGNAYITLFRSKRDGNLIEQAIGCYSQVLDKVEASSKDWADTQNNLGIAYTERVRGDRADNIEQAIRLYTQALEVYTRGASPEERAEIQNNLGNAYAERVRDDHDDNVERAIAYYTQALKVRTIDRSPVDHCQTRRNLGALYFRERNWPEAHKAYSGAIEAGNVLLEAAYTEAGRQSQVGETLHLYARASYCLLEMGRFAEALVQLEEGKTRLLDEALALSDVDPSALPKVQRRAMLEAREAVRELKVERRLPPDAPARRSNTELGDLLRRARADLNSLIKTIRQDHPDFMPTSLNLPGILALIPWGGALVAPLVTSQGSAVFVIPHEARTIGAEHVIWLDSSASGDLLGLLRRGPADAPRWGDWMRAYIDFHRDRTEKSALKQWQTAIKRITSQLWEALMGPIHERLVELGLAEGAPVVLMPQSWLGILPLLAAWRRVDGTPRYFIDDYTVSHTPSAYALDISRRRLQSARRSGHTLLAVVDPTSNLRYAPAEGEAVAALFAPAAQVLGQNATQAAVIAAAAGRAYLHFACHGFYDWGDAMRSGLRLADDDPFELGEIISPRFDLGAARLVTLSACETGLAGVRLPDQYVGLPAGFLQAGAAALVSSLWVVDDLSTMLLMKRFYVNHLHGDPDEEPDSRSSLPPAEALRRAQIWLRTVTAEELADRFERESAKPEAERSMPYEQASETWQRFSYAEDDDHPFDHPVYWAAFTYTGYVTASAPRPARPATTPRGHSTPASPA